MPSELKQAHLDHAGVSVSNLERSQRFYMDVLGFDVQEDTFELRQHQIRGVVLKNPCGSRIELFERKGSKPAPVAGHPTESTLVHGWFQAALAVRDIERAFAETTALGAGAVISPRIAPDGRALFAFISDPDGNLIELIQRPVG